MCCFQVVSTSHSAWNPTHACLSSFQLQPFQISDAERSLAHHVSAHLTANGKVQHLRDEAEALRAELETLAAHLMQQDEISAWGHAMDSVIILAESTEKDGVVWGFICVSSLQGLYAV